jgi:hypothetical protein
MFMCRERNATHNHNRKIRNKFCESAAKFKHFKTTLTNQKPNSCRNKEHIEFWESLLLLALLTINLRSR